MSQFNNYKQKPRVHQKVWGNLSLMSLIKAFVGSIGYLKMIRLKYKCHCPTLFDALRALGQGRFLL